MNEIKKMNLLPSETKNKYANKYVLLGFGGFFAVFILIFAFQLVNIGILSWQIKDAKAENERYTVEKEKIKALQTGIDSNKAFLTVYENGFFPFAVFMSDLENNRPKSVSIISVDSPDRLINEGVQDDEKDSKTAEKTEVEKDENDSEKKTETKDKSKSTDDSEQNADEQEEQGIKIEYINDLSGQEITIRGYGSNQEDISRFIYAISNLPYILSARTTAIEEHKIGGGIYNIFELKITGGALN